MPDISVLLQCHQSVSGGDCNNVIRDKDFTGRIKRILSAAKQSSICLKGIRVAVRHPQLDNILCLFHGADVDFSRAYHFSCPGNTDCASSASGDQRDIFPEHDFAGIPFSGIDNPTIPFEAYGEKTTAGNGNNIPQPLTSLCP